MEQKIILVTGATGYIASRLIPRLLEAGDHVRCLARQPERLHRRKWFPRVEAVAGDVARPETLHDAMKGVTSAFYLIHSMEAGRGYDRLDLQSARNFARAAQEAGVEHIIYLGGLADENENLSLHMRSRIETGAALREAGVPVTEFRAGVIIGPGSVSFEMIRFIAEQFPLMIGPRWLKNKSQPIAAVNVLDYLMAALTEPACRGKVIEIGGQDMMTYAESMSRYAKLRGLKRSMFLLPFIPVWFMAYFIHKLTPVHITYAFPLVGGLQNNSIIRNKTTEGLFSKINLLTYAESVHRSLVDLHPDTIERVWLDLDRDRIQVKHEGMLIDYVRARSDAPTETVFARVCQVNEAGGRLPDSYRVEFQNGLCLRLYSNLKSLGERWLEWQVIPQENGCILEQTAFFAPKGLRGFLYWYLLRPVRHAALNKLARTLAQPGKN